MTFHIFPARVAVLSLWLYGADTLEMWVPFAMKKAAISLFAILAGTSFAMAEDAGCEAFKW
ncbi:hypothetical protein EOB49_17910, partial [Mesorhizobium sp. M7A.F.Ca.MR.148.00.0.0]